MGYILQVSPGDKGSAWRALEVEHFTLLFNDGIGQGHTAPALVTISHGILRQKQCLPKVRQQTVMTIQPSLSDMLDVIYINLLTR